MSGTFTGTSDFTTTPQTTPAVESRKMVHLSFCYQLLQECTWAVGPPKIPIYRRQPPCHSLFRKFFLRGDVPISRYYGPQASRQFIKWHVPPEKLDYQRYLPLFFDGLCETAFPYREFARNGIRDMIAVAKEKQLLCCLPMLILPAKRALNSKDPDVIIATLRALQQLVQAGPWIGSALVPYYRQLLAIPNLFVAFNVNIGDQIDFQGGNRLGDVIDETLVLLERTGGRDAYLNIKYMVPTYESRVLNSPRETVIHPVKTAEQKLQSDTSSKQQEDRIARKRAYALRLEEKKKKTRKFNEAGARKHAELAHELATEDLVLKRVESEKEAYLAYNEADARKHAELAHKPATEDLVPKGMESEKEAYPAYNEADARKHAELAHELATKDSVLKRVDSEKEAHPAIADEHSPRETVQAIHPVKTVEKKLQSKSDLREDIEDSVQRKQSDTSSKQRDDLIARQREYALILETEKKNTPEYNEAEARKHAELAHELATEPKRVESEKEA